jgi:hypothetical protein
VAEGDDGRPDVSGKDHGAAELTLDLGCDVCAEESGQEAVMVLAEDHDIDSGVACRVDDRASRLAGGPHEVGPQAGRLDAVARLREQPDQLRRRSNRLPFPVGDVVEGAEVPVDLRIERDLEDREDDETDAPGPRLVDAAVERTAGCRRVVEADEDPTHAGSLRTARDVARARAAPCRRRLGSYG